MTQHGMLCDSGWPLALSEPPFLLCRSEADKGICWGRLRLVLRVCWEDGCQCISVITMLL